MLFYGYSNKRKGGSNGNIELKHSDGGEITIGYHGHMILDLT